MVKWITVSPGLEQYSAELERNMTASTEDDLADMPGIDVQAGLEVTRNNVKLYRRLLLKFRDGRTGYVSDLEDARNSNDLEALARAAHTIKGVAGNLGMTDVYNSVLSLELACKEHSENVDNLLTQVITNLGTVFESLQSISAD